MSNEILELRRLIGMLAAALTVHLDADRYDYAWISPISKTTIAELEAKYPMIVAEPGTPIFRIGTLREYATRLSDQALAEVRRLEILPIGNFEETGGNHAD